MRAEVAVLAVLREDDAGDLRVVLRHHEHEPAVIAQILIGLAARALLALVRNHLRGAGLAGDVAARDACRDRRCRRR